MDFLRTALHYASVAWGLITGIPSDVGRAFDSVWRFVGSLFSLVSQLFARDAKDLLQGFLQLIASVVDELDGQSRAIGRIQAWVYKYYIVPLRTFLLLVIARVALALIKRINQVRALAIALYRQSIAFTLRQVGIERSARIADVKAARAYALRLVNALHSTIESESAQAYNANSKARVTLITRVADEIATRNPVVRALVKDFTGLLIDFAGTENPAVRLLLKLLMPKIIDGLGIDKALGDLLTGLFGSVAGTPEAHDLPDAIGDLARRIGVMEDQWTSFMTSGGPEVEQAGEQWKSLTSLGVNASLLAFFGLAVSDPSGWATAVSNTAGKVVNDGAAEVARLIRSI